MNKQIQRFEDFVVWQRARELTREIYQITSEGQFARDYGLKNQIRRSAISSMSNVAEGFERGTPGEFHHFVTIAKGSCAELRSLLYVALDVGYLADNTFKLLMSSASEVANMLGGLRASIARRRVPKP